MIVNWIMGWGFFHRPHYCPLSYAFELTWWGDMQYWERYWFERYNSSSDEKRIIRVNSL